MGPSTYERFWAGSARLLLERIAVSLVLLLSISGISHAAIPYTNIVYSFYRVAEPAPQAYIPRMQVGGQDLGVGSFKDPEDLFVGPDRSIYVADTGNNRIVCLSEDLRTARVISEFDNNGAVDRFRRPSSVFVTADGVIYVADTGNSRIVKLNADGSLIEVLGAPVGDTDGAIPQGFVYQPVRVVVDSRGMLYVASRNTFDGLLCFDRYGDFRGFIGAPRVTPSAADLFWSRLATREQRERQALFLPIEYASIDIDDRGLIYAVEAGPAFDESIKRLNPSGVDVLKREDVHMPIGDVSVTEATQKSAFVDIASREMGIYSVLDITQGRVYTYDSMGSLLYTFGGIGQQLGAFTIPCALDSIGLKMVVLDKRTGLVTLFEPTQYARSIHAAIALYENGLYDESAAMWQQVLKLNANYDLAYVGIGRNLLRKDQFAEAMASLRLGNNRSEYSDAYRAYRRQLIENYFPAVAGAIILVIVAGYLVKRTGAGAAIWNILTPVRRWMSRGLWSEGSAFRNIVEGLRYSLYVVLHPFDGFWDLKHERRGNAVAASIILAMVAATYIIVRQYTGFLFNERDLARLNIYLELSSVLVPFALWCIVNWALTTLMDGKGTIEEIFITTAYALTPLILVNIPATVLSHFIVLEEAMVYQVLVAFGVLWAGYLMFIGTMTIHDYSGAKMTMISILTVVGMGFCIFMSMLFFSLLSKLVAMVMEVYTEVTFRL